LRVKVTGEVIIAREQNQPHLAPRRRGQGNGYRCFFPNGAANMAATTRPPRQEQRAQCRTKKALLWWYRHGRGYKSARVGQRRLPSPAHLVVVQAVLCLQTKDGGLGLAFW